MSRKHFHRQRKSRRQRTAQSHLLRPLYSGRLLQHPGLQNPDPGEPESGTAMFSSKQYGSTTYSGYYTDPTENPAGLRGRRYLLRGPHLPRKKSKLCRYLCGLYFQHGRHPSFDPPPPAGQSFYKSSGTWKDMTRIGNKSAVARIKAFTKDTAAAATSGTGSGSCGTVNTFHTKDPYLPLPGLQQRLSFLDGGSAVLPAIRSIEAPHRTVLIHGSLTPDVPALPIPNGGPEPIITTGSGLIKPQAARRSTAAIPTRSASA